MKMEHSRTQPRRRRASAVAVVLGMTLMILGTLTPSAGAASPDKVNFTLQGCRVLTSTTLPNGDGAFICSDGEYTTGNLGKNWAELDLVPHRLTAVNGGGQQTYDVMIAADNAAKGTTGYDFISVPVLNVGKSTGTCSVEVGALATLTPGVGGADSTMYRTLEITQSAGSTCVYDYYQRLSLGSSKYPGSSLHSNLLNENAGTAGIGARDVSIPVKEIEPQSISKTMSASQGAGHSWVVTKEGPASIHFDDTCVADNRTATADITVTWTKSDPTAEGEVKITTVITVTNPAHRTITANVTDVIYSGTTELDTKVFDPVDVPANSTRQLTHEKLIDEDDAVLLNDVATATYTDKVTGLGVPGETQATASVNQITSTGGTNANATAEISDLETITGPGLTFSVAAPSVGTFDGYTAGEQATSVAWNSGTLSENGSVTFSKTIHLDGAASISSEDGAKLVDEASLTGVDGFTTASNKLEIPITANASDPELTIVKTIPTAESSDVTFAFTVTDNAAGSEFSEPVSITVEAGKTIAEETIEVPVSAAGYTVTETQLSGWNAVAPKTVDGMEICESDSVTFANSRPGGGIVVIPDPTTTTTVAPTTTTTVAPTTTTTTEPPEVAPVVVEPTTTTTVAPTTTTETVLGVVQERVLPRTGDETRTLLLVSGFLLVVGGLALAAGLSAPALSRRRS
jgi:hypothetical protein